MVAAYALGIMHKAKVKNLYITGFDGYKDNPILNEQMEKIFKKYKNLNKSPDLISLTPSLYKGINKLNLV